MMYEKNLTADFRLRLTQKDMEFLRQLSEERGCSVSEVVRSIIGEYRRSIEMTSAIATAMSFYQEFKESGGQLFNGNTKSDIDNIV